MAKATQEQEKIKTIVGIGASAGGLNALRKLFKSIPENTGMTFVVVVHLSPEHKSILSELLQPHCSIPVQQVNSTIPIKPNNIYVIPPNANLNSIDTHLRLSELEEKRSQRAPIDHFFRTLSATHDGNSIGIILTGTGSDGALGIKEIKGRNGIVIVQDPNEAEYDGMPQSAIATGIVDLILPIDEIHKHLIGLSKVKPKIQLKTEEDQPDADQQQILQKIFAQVRARTSRDFSRYKSSTIMRRLHRRMQIYHLSELTEYLELLRTNADEVRSLSDDFLITVSNFFRDSDVFQRLQDEVIPRLFKDKGPEDNIRIWSVGCATGEEAYSLAILLLEEASRRQMNLNMQVFASDMHERSLKMARDGFYPGDIEPDVSSDRLRRFFIKEDGGYRIRKEVREIVIFTPHNLLNDPPFSKLDMIVCRNLLIYLKRDVQQDVFDLFHYALLPDGVMVLGTSEHLDSSELFRTEHKDHSFYIKRNITGPEPKLPVFPLTKTRLTPGQNPKESYNYHPINFRSLHQRWVEKFAPPSLLVSLEYQILHLSENAGRYLIYPGGEPTQNLFKLIREELRIELRGSLQDARDKNETVHSKPVNLTIDGQMKQVSMSVRLTDDSTQEKFALIIFEEREISDTKPKQIAKFTGDNRENLEVEEELRLTQQRLQAIIEEYETTQEEMKASNEELQSANEELRSTMEELETSKEELQSMNEELSTVNQENRHKVEELSQLSGDLQNLLAATDIATLFLDRDFQILRFTPKVGEIFSIRAADKGRPITDLTHRLGYPDLMDDAKKVLRNLIPVEQEVEDEEGQWFLTRVLPYRSNQDRIEGVVITFVDITSRKNAEEALRRSEEQFRALVEASSQMVWTTDKDGEMVEDSASWRQFTGQRYQEWKGNGWLKSVHPEDRDDVTTNWQQAIAEEKVMNTSFRIWHEPSNNWRWTNLRAVPLRKSDNTLRGWMGMNIDIDELKAAEKALRETRDLLEMARSASKLGWGTLDFTTGKAHWDERSLQIFELKKQKNAIEDWIDIIHPEDKQRVEKKIESCKQTGNDFDLEYRIIADDIEDKTTYIHHTSAFQKSADGKIIKGTGHVRNITEKKMLQKQKDDFMSMASHEMKTPVAVMKGYMGMIREIFEEKEYAGKESTLVNKLDEQINRLTSLINDLLDISRIESGKIIYQEEEFIFDEVVNEAVESMQPMAKQHLITEGSCSKNIKGDKERITQVIINFISNAIKFSPGEERILISISEEKNRVQLSVQDFGAGIDEKDKELVFDRYFRSSEHSTTAPGLGLGLYISAQIILRHKGHIWVESVKNDGAVFSFTLPLGSSND